MHRIFESISSGMSLMPWWRTVGMRLPVIVLISSSKEKNAEIQEVFNSSFIFLICLSISLASKKTDSEWRGPLMLGVEYWLAYKACTVHTFFRMRAWRSPTAPRPAERSRGCLTSLQDAKYRDVMPYSMMATTREVAICDVLVHTYVVADVIGSTIEFANAW